MQAKNLNTRVSIKGSNVVKVRKWKLLVEAVLATGERLSFHPEQSVRVMPERDTNGQFIPRNYIIAMVENGRDVINTFTGRTVARRYLKIMRETIDPNAVLIAL